MIENLTLEKTLKLESLYKGYCKIIRNSQPCRNFIKIFIDKKTMTIHSLECVNEWERFASYDMRYIKTFKPWENKHKPQMKRLLNNEELKREFFENIKDLI